jgi:hypothetical protein
MSIKNPQVEYYLHFTLELGNTLIVPSFQLPLKLHIGMLLLTHEHNLLIENFTKRISNKSSISKGKLWDLIFTMTTYHQHGKQI